MYIIMYICVHTCKKKKNVPAVCLALKMGDHLNLQFPFFTSSWTLQLLNWGGGGGERLYLSRVVRNPSRVIPSGFTEYICRS